MQQGPRSAAERDLQASRGDRRRFVFAAAASVVAHLVVLSLLPSQPSSRQRPEPAAVALTARLVDVPAPPAPAAAVPPAPAPAAVAVTPPPPALVPRPAPVPVPAPPPASPPAQAAPATTAATEAAPATPAPAFVPAEELDQQPVPSANPLQDLANPGLVWRRLAVTVSLDAEGRVLDVKVSRYELSDELAQQVEQAVAAIRFAPGVRDGQAVATQVQTRLCFDGAGQLETASKGCWRAPASPER